LFATISPGFLGVVVYFAWKRGRRMAEWTFVVASLLPVLLILSIMSPVFEAYERGENPLVFAYPWVTPVGIEFGFLIDMVSYPVCLVIAIVSALSCIYSTKYMEKDSNLAGYYASLLLLITGMIGVVLSANLFQFYFFWELMLVPSYILIAQWGTTRGRLRVGFKYFIFTHAGALFMLLGILFIFSYAGTASLADVHSRLGDVPPNVIGTTCLLLMIGFLVKMAAFPLHAWLPDSYTAAPIPVAAMLSGAVASCGAYGMARLVVPILAQWAGQAADYLMVLGIVTMVYGGLITFSQSNVKRALAYSSISQAGYVLFGFGTLSTLGIMGSLLHIVNQAVCKSLLFLSAGLIIGGTNTQDVRKMGGLMSKMPITGLALLISAFSLSGVPPLNGFWSEWLIFAGGLASGKIALTFIGVASAMITPAYFLWFAWRILFGNLREGSKDAKEQSPTLLFPVVVLASASVILGIWPGIFLEFIAPAARSLSSLG